MPACPEFLEKILEIRISVCVVAIEIEFYYFIFFPNPVTELLNRPSLGSSWNLAVIAAALRGGK